MSSCTHHVNRRGRRLWNWLLNRDLKKKKKWPTSVSEIEFLPVEGHFCVGVDTRGSLMRRTACAPLHKYKLSLPKQQFQHVGAAAWNSWQSARTYEACHLACNRQPSRFWMTGVCWGRAALRNLSTQRRLIGNVPMWAGTMCWVKLAKDKNENSQIK